MDVEKCPDSANVNEIRPLLLETSITLDTNREENSSLTQSDAEAPNDDLTTDAKDQHTSYAMSLLRTCVAEEIVDLEKQQPNNTEKKAKDCDNPHCEYCARVPLAIIRALAIASLPMAVLIYGLPVCDEKGHAFFMAYLWSWAFYSGSIVQRYLGKRFLDNLFLTGIFLWPIWMFTFWTMLNSSDSRSCPNDE